MCWIFQSKILISFVVLIFLLPLITAHGGVAGEQERGVWANPARYIKLVGVWATLLIVFLIALRKQSFMRRKPVQHLFFWLITAPVVLSSLYLGWNTIYENITSETGGPIHWHADFEVWNCGEEVELIDPEGIMNRVGSSLVHEHNDKRVHIEGTVLDWEKIDLEYFFQAIGGSLDPLRFQTNEGLVEIRDGQLCQGGPGKVQVFVYKIVNAYASQKDGFIYQQEKLDDPEHYIISPYGNVPPGDCIIIEFDQEKEKTDKICDSYEVALSQGRMKEEK